jgi:predicted RNA methylase
MKVSEFVSNVIESSEVHDNLLILTAQLSRVDYVTVNKVLEAMGGKWNKKLKGHLFDSSEALLQAIDTVMITGEVTTNKDMDYFPTPDNVIEQMIEFGGVERNSTVLEPSAGTGHIVKKLLAMECKVTCVELNEKRAEELKKLTPAVKCMDFLQCPSSQGYDYVIMNPPFSKQADIDHVCHAFEFLLNGGTLVSVMASNITFRENSKTVKFRKFLEDHGGEIVKLDSNSFKESGTGVSTVLVKITK